jgi:ferrous iron transport protein A
VFDNILPLDNLAPGSWAEVIDLSGTSVHLQRLAELGLRPGARLRMIQPGCPCLFQLGGARFSIRCDDDVQILVRPLNEGAHVFSEVA